LGGIIGTLPSTIVPAAIGIYLSSKGAAFDDAMNVVPLGMFVNVFFLWVWQVLPERLSQTEKTKRIVLTTLVSLVVWSIGAFLLVSLLKVCTSEQRRLMAWGALVLMGSIGLFATYRVRPSPKGTRKVSMTQWIMRGLFAAVAIGLSVAIAKSGMAIAAGMASVFPALFLTTMVSLSFAQDAEVSAGAVGSMMLGATSVGLFAVMSCTTYAHFGPWWGTAVAWVATILSCTVPCTLWVLWRQKSAS